MPPNELRKLLPRHFEIVRLCLQGLRIKDIAMALKPPMSADGVGIIINSPLFQDELVRRRRVQDAQDRDLRTDVTISAIKVLEDAASSAAQTHVDLLESKSERTQQISANAILDRVLQKGGDDSAGVKIDADVINILHITINELKENPGESNAPPIERKDVDVA